MRMADAHTQPFSKTLPKTDPDSEMTSFYFNGITCNEFFAFVA